MAKFITNINLQDANEIDYDRLHKELGKESFTCGTSRLRTKSYIDERNVFFREGSITIHDATAAVMRATYKAGKKYSFFVLKEKFIPNSIQ